jgi:hypothetical protein
MSPLIGLVVKRLAVFIDQTSLIQGRASVMRTLLSHMTTTL